MNKKVKNQEICKHGMIWKMCHFCQKVEYETTVKFPITVTDDDGEEKRIFLRRKVKRIRYRGR